jgi:hypothetical protein
MAKKRGTRPKAKRQIVRAGDLLPEGCEEFLGELKERIRTARLRASLAANRELIELYWHIGRSVVEKQKTSGWGNAVIAHLGDDLQKAFPGESGFSRTNVYRMRACSSPARSREGRPTTCGTNLRDGTPTGRCGAPLGPDRRPDRADQGSPRAALVCAGDLRARLEPGRPRPLKGVAHRRR